MKYIFSLVLALSLLASEWAAWPVQAQGGGTYIVRQGDTLSSIAAYYGTTPYDLAAMNGLGDAWIYAGQQLIVPSTPSFNPSFPSGNYPQANPFFQPPPSPPQGFYPVFSPYGGPPPFGWNVPQEQEPVWVDFTTNQSSPSYNWSQSAGYPASSPPGYQPLASPAQRPGPQFQPPLHIPPVFPPRFNNSAEKWIDVDLTTQTLVAYENQTPVFRARVSTGLPQYPTVTGTFHTYVKYEKADMSGGYGSDEYYLPDVPYVMYFYGNYGLHGTYWHNNFGTPMSHGCVNLSTPDAKWLFEWAPLGTRVVTHY